MRALTLIVAGPDEVRLRSAARLAAAAAALGHDVRLFLDAESVPLVRWLHRPGSDTGDLLATGLDLGVALILCQTGLADAGIDLSTLDPRVTAGGLTALLATLDDGRLVTL